MIMVDMMNDGISVNFLVAMTAVELASSWKPVSPSPEPINSLISMVTKKLTSTGLLSFSIQFVQLIKDALIFSSDVCAPKMKLPALIDFLLELTS